MEKIQKSSFVLFIAFLLSISLYAQDTEIDLNATLPQDPDVIIGKLDNGLTYYIRKNETPRERGQFWLIVNAGAINEDDDQDGLAHFCEHMAFNGTKHFPGKGILDAMGALGVKFGPNVNAFTGHDATTYMLQKVPTSIETNIDTALLILYDWAHNISFEGEEIDKERGVIHEEWRSRRGANARLSDKTQPVILKNSKYAKRNVIGDMNIVDNCPHDALTRFYKDWYRPDLQTIIAVGDFDVKLVEDKIKILYSQIPKPTNPREREIYLVPDHNETYVVIATDKEARYIQIWVYYMHDIEKDKTTGNYLREQLKHSLYNMMINERLGELLQEEFPPFLVGMSGYGAIVRSKNSYVARALTRNNEFARGLRTLLEEIERLKKHGFVDTELERNKRVYMKYLVQDYKERYKQKSNRYCWGYYSNFLTNEPMPGIEFEYEFTKQIINGITLEEMNKLAPKWITDKNKVIVVTGPDRPEVNMPREDKVLRIISSIKTENLKPYVDRVSTKPLIAKDDLPSSSKVDDKVEIEEFEAVEWTLKNGIKVVLKQTDFKEDEILFRAFSLGGSSLYPDRDFVSATIADDVIRNSGVAELDKIELDKKIADKVVNIYPSISELQESIRGNSSPEDFETLLQLVYLYFTKPGKDNKAYSSYYNRQIGIIENRSNDPATAMRDTLRNTMAQYHSRRRPWTKELLGEANFNRAHFIYRDRFADASDFTFFFVGNIDMKKMKPLIETYIGGLPCMNRKETWKDLNINPPDGKIEKVVYQKMETPKASIVLRYHGDYDYNIKNRLHLTTLCDILDLRYTEEIRENKGGTYGVTVRPTNSHFPKSRYTISIYFECDPDEVEELSKIIFDEIEKIKANGPLEKDLNKVKENLLKKRKEDLRENRFWLNVLRNHYYHKEDFSTVLDYEKYVNDLSIESIKQATSFLNPDNYVKVTLLPEKE